MYEADGIGLFVDMRTRAPVTMSPMEGTWPDTPLRWLRAVGNVVNLSTLFGLAVALIGRARIRRGPRGLIVCEGYQLKFPVASAFTIGNVLTTSHTWDSLLRHNPNLLKHEERHTWQYLYCLGLPFYVLYLIFMGWSVLRTGDRAARHFFERQAGLADGEYAEVPVKPLGENVRALLAKLKFSRPGASKP